MPARVSAAWSVVITARQRVHSITYSWCQDSLDKMLRQMVKMTWTVVKSNNNNKKTTESTIWFVVSHHKINVCTVKHWLFCYFLLWRRQQQPSCWHLYFNICCVAQRTKCLSAALFEHVGHWASTPPCRLCPGLAFSCRHGARAQNSCVHINQMKWTLRSSVLRSPPGPLVPKHP